MVRRPPVKSRRETTSKPPHPASASELAQHTKHREDANPATVQHHLCLLRVPSVTRGYKSAHAQTKSGWVWLLSSWLPQLKNSNRGVLGPPRAQAAPFAQLGRLSVKAGTSQCKGLHEGRLVLLCSLPPARERTQAVAVCWLHLLTVCKRVQALRRGVGTNRQAGMCCNASAFCCS